MSTQPISDDELTAMETRCASASRGPWEAFTGGGLGGPEFIRVGGLDDNEPDMYVTRDSETASTADLNFIAAARQDVPRLLAEVRRLRAVGQ